MISRFSVRFNSVFSVSVRLGFYIVTRARFLGNSGNDFGFGSVLKYWPGSVFGFSVNRENPLQYRFLRNPLTDFDRLFQFGLVFGLP